MCIRDSLRTVRSIPRRLKTDLPFIEVRGEVYMPVSYTHLDVYKRQVHIKAAGEYGNNAALTPPMGWSSWNTFRKIT